ncbi:pilus assembly protein TadG-related protein [Salinactinospora qingdaonensis]|uniref:Putative Flp pilus-assembly TadG-like N-terminal domain-containing protein n=1 Tax=Salinactinospora qingdaonensis TaxID=702744 RepID=A0ABP7FNS9_9ACTN
MTRTRHDDSGQVTAFVVILTAALLLLFALVFEGGTALATRSRALSLAQEAARAGAQEIDLAAYRAGDSVRLTPRPARHAARTFLTQAGAEGTVQVNGDTVTVTARLDHTFTLLPLGTRSLQATATARPHTTP